MKANETTARVSTEAEEKYRRMRLSKLLEIYVVGREWLTLHLRMDVSS